MNLSFKNAGIIILALFLLKESLDAIIRYYLASINLVALTYVPIFLIVIYVVFNFWAELKRTPYFSSIAIIVMVIISSVVGFLNLGQLTPALFAIYVFFPFFFGIQTGDLVYRSILIKRLALIMIFILSAGVIMEWMGELPWKGFSYEIGGVEIEASRSWASLGIQRLSGFARTSYNFAILTVCFLILLYGRINHFAYFLLFLASFFVVSLSTTKGVMLVYIVLALLFIAGWMSRFLFNFGFKATLGMSLMVGIVLPISTLWVMYDLDLYDIVMRVIFLSFEMRLTDVWPEAMENFAHWNDYITGKGAGNVGVASMIYNPENYNPVDNLYLYVLIVFGVPFIVLLAILLRRIFKLKESDIYINLLMMATFIFVYGIFTNVLESGILAYFLGTLISVAFNRSPEENEKSTEISHET
ncbi:hypothetical protein [Natronoflexus pectinivorans]|uniref:O-antigen ligase-like membrane protein n=1 Tax=Natronoflexus pectinivorans TaxID=682526 RepID=A0A4R2GI74_9BACT|nr:hypothetical protein [Natronoflexus pectinivorans]TCO07891.1 hypothetical protein EV194_10631 [Natronoflexus pectinivorans]